MDRRIDRFQAVGLITLLVVTLSNSTVPLLAQDASWTFAAHLNSSVDEQQFEQSGHSHNPFIAAEVTDGVYKANSYFTGGIETNSSAGTLRSRATLDFILDGYRNAQALATSKATLNDIVTIQTVSGWAANVGYLEFVWNVHGVLTTSVRSTDGRDLTPYTGSGNANAQWNWGYYLRGELSVDYYDAVAHQQKNISLYSQSMERKANNATLSGAVKDFDILIPLDDLKSAVFDPAVTAISENLPIDEKGVGGALIHAPGGIPFAVTYNLSAGVSSSFLNEDGVPLDGRLESAFYNTAELVGVRLYEEDGTPYSGAWSLQSANGIEYRVLSIPEPSALALAAFSAIGLLFARHCKR